MLDAVLVHDTSRWRARGLLVQKGFDPPLRIAIEQKNGFQVRARCPQQLQSVGLGCGVSLLMREDDPSVVGLQSPQPDKPLSDQGGTARSLRGSKLLTVGIKCGDCGSLTVRQDPPPAPVAEPRRRPRVNIVHGSIARSNLPLDESGIVVGTAPEIFLLHLGGDLVERLGYDVFKGAHFALVVTKRCKR